MVEEREGVAGEVGIEPEPVQGDDPVARERRAEVRRDLVEVGLRGLLEARVDHEDVLRVDPAPEPARRLVRVGVRVHVLLLVDPDHHRELGPGGGAEAVRLRRAGDLGLRLARASAQQQQRREHGECENASERERDLPLRALVFVSCRHWN
jgi:hypothetical protein